MIVMQHLSLNDYAILQNYKDNNDIMYPAQELLQYNYCFLGLWVLG